SEVGDRAVAVALGIRADERLRVPGRRVRRAGAIGLDGRKAEGAAQTLVVTRSAHTQLRGDLGANVVVQSPLIGSADVEGLRRRESPGRAPGDGALLAPELRTVADEEPRLVALDGAAEREDGVHLIVRVVVRVLRNRDVFRTRRVGRNRAQAGAGIAAPAEVGQIGAGAAPEVVGAALRDDADDAAEGRLVLGVVAGLLHLDLFDEVLLDDLRAADRRTGARPGVGAVDAVDEIAVLRTGRAVDHQAARAGSRGAGVFVVRSRDLREQTDETAALGHGFDHLVADRRGRRIRFGVDERRLARDLDAFGQAADLEREIDLQGLTEIDDCAGLRRAEAGEGRGDLIRPGGQGGETKHARGIGHRGEDTRVARTA